MTPATAHPAAPTVRVPARTGPFIASLAVVTVPPAPRPPRRRRRARAALVAFAAAVLLLHLGAAALIDGARPRLRDPEYGIRTDHLRARVAEHPGRPLVLVVGSSRTAMGVRPGAWEAARPGAPHDPLLFNMSVAGAGPVTELLVLRRVFADGFRPAVVLLEYWPPMFRQDGDCGEAARFDARRLRVDDRSVVRDYFPDPDAVERRMRIARLDVFHANRDRLLVQALPDWTRRAGRPDGSWVNLDRWGWLPGMMPETDAERRKLTDHHRPGWRDRLAGFAIDPASDRALREAAVTARAHGAAVGFLYMPESAEFRSWYPPGAEGAGRAHLAALARGLGAPVIDARDWAAAGDLADGFHLSRDGAAAFAPRLGRAVAAAFPATGGEP